LNRTQSKRSDPNYAQSYQIQLIGSSLFGIGQNLTKFKENLVDTRQRGQKCVAQEAVPERHRGRSLQRDD
jgi:hypothetical protein